LLPKTPKPHWQLIVNYESFLKVLNEEPKPILPVVQRLHDQRLFDFSRRKFYNRIV